jgi:hypothetical protein
MKTWILGIIAVSLPWTLAMAEDAATITTGGRTLSLPDPQGFPRVDLVEPLSKDLEAAVTSSGNRLLALYGTPPVTIGGGPIFHAQTPKGTEDIIYSTQQFQEVISSLTTLLGDPVSQGDIANGDSHSLGIYDQGEHHLNFATLRRQDPKAEDEEGLLTYVAASMNNVHGKAINLYCLVAAEPESNRALAREQLATWQQTVLASNPTAQPEVIEPSMTPMQRGAMIGTAAGLLGALIGLLVLKRKKA